jgi:hypothetical protein
MDLVGQVVEFNREYKVDYWVVDKTGVGQGVYDRLKDMDYPVRGVSFGEKSDDDQYQNLKSEWHFRERKWLLSGGRLLANSGWNEFEYVKYKNKDGKIIIQPKEDLFREGIMSPNCVDAAVLTMVVNDQMIKSQRISKANIGRVPYDRMQAIMNEGPDDKIERYE